MTAPDPEFDAVHPSGHILFRSCRGGYLHSVALAEPAMDADAHTLAQAILLTADVSYLKALMQIRAEIVAAGQTPSDDVAGHRELALASEALARHRLRPDG
ncbi:DUF2694 family protein [Mycobacterium sp. shizuoka-1]|uniref:DUF2694 family protein n=1 Tax=Mycobacterium sp. shizuoka-1 TaxID=2039281 RepID=UPI000C062651|nr:DUF2694 family protein [Mycobacterium sp. shizuoka-1]GAY13953.1 hypothetical protein MSZK_06790 [Mycobacterium sp. shizuoka-1]